MAAGSGQTGRLPEVFTTPGISSFTEFLRQAAPDLLPGRRPLPPGDLSEIAPHGTTIVSVAFHGGVVMVGDRRATMGNYIANRDMVKVFPADAYSVVGIAGTAGLAKEMVRLYQVELEHYEKLQGTHLSLHGKANRLASMIRGNLGAALQGLAVVPLFAGVDHDADDDGEAGRIYGYDVTGGLSEEKEYDAVGSGSMFAKNSLKKRYRRGGSADDAVRVALEAVYDAAEEDTATGGPDLTRRIFPVVMVVDADGVRELSDEEVGQAVERVVAGRMENPGG